MLFVHETFFEYNSTHNKLCDVSKILQTKLKSILNKEEYIFSSLYPKTENIHFTKEGIQIQDLGGVLTDDEPFETTSLVLTSEYKCKE